MSHLCPPLCCPSMPSLLPPGGLRPERAKDPQNKHHFPSQEVGVGVCTRESRGCLPVLRSSEL